MRRCVNQHHFEGRSNRACEKMATRCRAVGQPENDVNVKAGLAVVPNRYVPNGAQDLALLSDLNLFVSLIFEIEPSNRRFLESADAVSEAAVSLASFANLVSAANASSPESKITTRSLIAPSPAILALFMGVRPRFVGGEGVP
jgi:hypothetical protein